jgi:hypothetical protein
MAVLAANSSIILFLVLGLGGFLAWSSGTKRGENRVTSWSGSGAVNLKQGTFVPPVLLIGLYLLLNALLG